MLFMQKGKIYVIGCGPGAYGQLTIDALEAVRQSHIIMSYKTYTELLSDVLTDQIIIPTGMTENIEQAYDAIDKALEGNTVAILSSGDASIYGMSGMLYEALHERNETTIDIEILPGISALSACASLVGAPFMHDHCAISLNEKTTPWEIIEKRIEAAAMGDFVLAFYNPKTGYQTPQMLKVQAILLAYRNPNTPVGIVRGAFRTFQEVHVTTVEKMHEQDIGMVTTIFIGNHHTYLRDGVMVTPRSYQQSFTIGEKREVAPVEQVSSPTVSTARIVNLPKFDSIFEVAISPGVANKFYSTQQLATLSQLIADKGTIEYTADHKMIVKVPTDDPKPLLEKLEQAQFLVSPVGHVVNIKACDFCHGEKIEALPYAEELEQQLGGLKVPMPLNIGFNGCSMTCYGAVFDDIGIVYRKRNFDLYIGAKSISKTAHAAKFVAEGIAMEELVPTVVRVVKEYQQNANNNERLYQYFRRKKEIAGFDYY